VNENKRGRERGQTEGGSKREMNIREMEGKRKRGR
jgi:hypothetical protein